MLKICRLDAELHLNEVELLERSTMPQPWSRKLLADELRSASGFHFGLWSEDRLVGQLFSQRVVDELSLLNISVSPDCRRRGFARTLLLEVLNQARDEGLCTVFLEVREGNQAARALYEKAGFQRTGQRSAYYSDNGENALLYSCRISEPDWLGKRP